MTVYTARIRYRQTGTTAVIVADTYVALSMKLLLLAPYAEVLDITEVNDDERPSIH